MNDKERSKMERELKKYNKIELITMLADYVEESLDMLEEYNIENSYAESSKKKEVKEFKLLTPMEIKNKLDESVIGQDDAKIKLSTEVFRHYLRLQNEDKLHKDGKKISKNNILLTGLTGTGKTHICECVSKILDVAIYIEDTSSKSATGFIGGSVDECVAGLLKVSDYDVKRAERGIIVLDEIDKLSSRNDDPRSNASRKDVQEELLKIIEGKTVSVKNGSGYSTGATVDTSNILFIGCGAFQEIEKIVKQRMKVKTSGQSIGFNSVRKEKEKELSKKELRMNVTKADLKEYGLMEELLGRFSVLSNLHPLEKEDYINILKNKNGLFDEYKTVFELMHKKLIIKDEIYEYIAEKAMSDLSGARSLKTIVENLLYKTIYEMPSSNKKQYILNNKFLESIE